MSQRGIEIFAKEDSILTAPRDLEKLLGQSLTVSSVELDVELVTSGTAQDFYCHQVFFKRALPSVTVNLGVYYRTAEGVDFVIDSATLDTSKAEYNLVFDGRGFLVKSGDKLVIKTTDLGTNSLSYDYMALVSSAYSEEV